MDAHIVIDQVAITSISRSVTSHI